MNTLYQIPPEVVEVYAPKIKAYLKRGMGRRPVYSLDWVFSAAKESWIQLWAAHDERKIFGAGMTEIVTFPDCKIMAVRLWSADDGRRDDWFFLLKDIEIYARSIGLDGVMIEGRDGWVKMLKSQGYDVNTVTVRKMFDDAKQSQSTA